MDPDATWCTSLLEGHPHRLLLRRVMASEKRRKVIGDEHPPAARLRAENQAALGPDAKLFRVHLQTAGGPVKRERVHCQARKLARGQGEMSPIASHTLPRNSIAIPARRNFWIGMPRLEPT